ncbi:MAG: 2-succinylbenzoate--CoA ligase [Symplocastrum torsivum CPER-KK1]|jgi:O-succinylbenzoic acid--CoA ligase|uniref:2-succinylbenzoate--CoA ligase n=1 Tax=Symplocastrum torsivum CPER-KK1 TaxID=450513 RepID=A0A951UDJ8_9CYAN|nr:2-succinylbenzoate--CoA ligase [Symplocastrum torsivum CPER-KK1]
MEGTLVYLKQRANEDWLIGHDSHQFSQLSEQLFLDLTQQKNRKAPLKIIVAEQEPVRFLASFIAACAAECHVFLCNPNWVEQEWQQVFNLVQPDVVWGDLPVVSPKSLVNSFLPPLHLNNKQPATDNKLQIMIPTGGSSGQIRFAIHTWETLMASVRGFHQYFGEKPINSFCVLPLYHVSGLMQFLRSFTTGGRMVILPFKALVTGEEYHLDPGEFFISLVPTQLARLITSGSSTWLSRFQTVLLGGAPAWAELLEQARGYNIPVALTYGMTETASQVVTLKPEDFLSGNNSCGQVLPHASVTIRSSTDEILGANQTGIVTIESDSLALGYYPHEEIQNLKSDDLGFFDKQGYLTIVGRRSHKIITGGENVFPAEIEAVIRSTQLVSDVCVIGLPDDYWGQAVTAVYVPSSLKASPTLLKTAVENKLCKFKRPKYWVTVEHLPRNAQGKVNYEQLKRLTANSLVELLQV